jgi:hypothetical protein
MPRRVLFPAVVAGLLAAVGSAADAPAPPAKAPAEYIKVEIRGKLQPAGRFAGDSLEQADLFDQAVKVKVHDMPLAFKDKELAEQAKKLVGKTVLVSGDLSRVAGQRTAVQPTYYVYYVTVTALKAAD